MIRDKCDWIFCLVSNIFNALREPWFFKNWSTANFYMRVTKGRTFCSHGTVWKFPSVQMELITGWSSWHLSVVLPSPHMHVSLTKCKMASRKRKANSDGSTDNEYFTWTDEETALPLNVALSYKKWENMWGGRMGIDMNKVWGITRTFHWKISKQWWIRSRPRRVSKL